MIKDLSQIVNHCQRNWDYTPIPKQHIDHIVNAGRFMPTKQNHETYTIVKITNPTVISRLYEQAYNSNSLNYGHQPQVDAPLLLAFLINRKKSSSGDNPNKEVDYNQKMLEIGLSAGACALQAAELGYKTGFCRCLSDPNAMLKKTMKLDRTLYQLVVLLGIGLPDPTLAHNIQKVKTPTFPQRDGAVNKMFTKSIEVISIT